MVAAPPQVLSILQGRKRMPSIDERAHACSAFVLCAAMGCILFRTLIGAVQTGPAGGSSQDRTVA